MTVPSSDDPKFSLFDSCTNTGKPSEDLSISSLIEAVRGGRWEDEVLACRTTLKHRGKEAYDSHRQAIVPAFTLSASVKHRRRKTTLEQRGAIHSGFLQLDFDAKDHEGMTPDEIRSIVFMAPFVVGCFVSLSGDGIKAIALCPADFTTHKGSWHAADAYCKEKGLTIDPSTKDPCRLCFVSHDPDALYCDEAVPIVPIPIPQKADNGEGSNGTEDPEHVRRKLSELADKLGCALKRDTWIHVCGLTKDAVGGDLAAELVDEFFPPQQDGDQSACDIMEPLDGCWLTLRKYGIDPVDYSKFLPDLSGFENEDLNEVKDDADCKNSLRERAYALRFDPNEVPPPDETCMTIGEIPIASRGNLTAIQGKSKVGKSAVISAVLGASQRGSNEETRNTLCIDWVGVSQGAIVHLDTEQSRSDWHELVCRSVSRSGLAEVSPRLVSLPLVPFARSDRKTILRQTLIHERAMKGCIDALLIDGVADLCASPNDEAEALELVSWLMAQAQEFNCPIICVLHENPSTDTAKTRGHLGSELNRKAFANLRIDKDSETSVSTIYGTDMRKREIPKQHGFCFAWDDAAKMHTFRGREAGLKSERRESEKLKKSRGEWETIYEAAASETNGECPELTPEQAVEAHRDIAGTKAPVAAEAMKKRMQRAEFLGVLRKTGAGRWSLNSPGQTGQIRDI